MPRDKFVVLGLVSTKKGGLEPAGELLSRIDDASRYFPREQLGLSTQCGFASGIKGNPIDAPTQEKKLRLVAEVAARAWR
jgi:5-methyltetrahydropteroyltriglutamate--homocysteine methyltransferase